MVFSFQRILVSKNGPICIFVYMLLVAVGSVKDILPSLTVHSGINSKHLIMPQNMSQQEAERIDGSA